MTTSTSPNPAGFRLVETALASSAPALKPAGCGAWELSAPAGEVPPLLAEAVEGWLLLSTPVVSEVPGTWELLLLGAALPPLLKVTLAPNGGLRLRADLAAGDAALLAERVAGALRAFPGALRALAGQHPMAENLPADPATLDTVAGTSPEELLTQADWPFTLRGDAGVAVRLEVPGGHHQALVARHGSGIRLAVECGAWQGLTPESRAALGAFLLAVAHPLRLARGFAIADPSGTSAGFEVLLPAEANSADMTDALSALSVAVGLAAAAVTVLEDPELAKEYLRIQGELPAKQQTKERNNNT